MLHVQNRSRIGRKWVNFPLTVLRKTIEFMTRSNQLAQPNTLYDACDVTLSVYPHRASLKNMPDHGGNRTYDLFTGQAHHKRHIHLSTLHQHRKIMTVYEFIYRFRLFMHISRKNFLSLSIRWAIMHHLVWINNFKNMPWILTLSEQRKLLVKKDLILLIIIFGKACFTIARLQSYIVTEIKWCFMWRVRFLKRTMKSYLVLNYFRPVFSIINQNN
jgi:hypothetical protein